jgi:cytochrome c oxidase subunit 3
LAEVPVTAASHAPVPGLQHHFDSIEQQKEAAALGMWVFLVTELLFFGGLILAYTIYRWEYARAFAHASLHMDVTLGAVNTVVLICSSLTMAMAVHSAATGRRRLFPGFLVTTMLLGGAFLAIKAIEYTDHIRHHLFPGPGFRYPVPADARAAEMFFSLYFAMTGLHALHMIVGLGILATLLALARRGRFTAEYSTPVEISGLYWHFVDIVWIFLFPLLYLIGRHLH